MSSLPPMLVQALSASVAAQLQGFEQGFLQEEEQDLLEEKKKSLSWALPPVCKAMLSLPLHCSDDSEPFYRNQVVVLFCTQPQRHLSEPNEIMSEINIER